MATASPKEVEKCLQGIDYPAKKEDLINHAKSHGADQQVMETLEQLPEEEFQSPVGVNKAIGEINRQSGGTNR
jgi:glutamine phosphoribosylpyrophosphate amidotransferase